MHDMNALRDAPPQTTTSWKDVVRKYQTPSWVKSGWQLANTIIPYFALWVAMYFLKEISIWLALPVAILAGGFIIRTFIIFHDCVHGSFFRTKRANAITGFFTGLLTLTSFHHWRWEHIIHHSTASDLGKRGIGDVWTMTVEEYLAASKGKKLAYRISRNPIILFGIAPVFVFFLYQRFPAAQTDRRIKIWTHITSLSILALSVGLSAIFGVWDYLILHVVAMGFASGAGVWLFYVQHQFEDVYWDRKPDWDFARAALEGSSFYKLPKILQWFTGSIGFHHIHHLSPRIPNYELERAHRMEPMFQEIKPMTIRTSLKCLTFRLWDEQDRKLTGYPSRRRRQELMGTEKKAS